MSFFYFFFFFLALRCRAPLCVLFVKSVFNYHLLQWLMGRQSKARVHLSVHFSFLTMLNYGFFFFLEYIHECFGVSVSSQFTLCTFPPHAKMFGELKRRKGVEGHGAAAWLEENGAPRRSDTCKLEADWREIPQLVPIGCLLKHGNKKPMWNLIGRRYVIQTSLHTAQFQQNLTSVSFSRSLFPDYRSPGCWVPPPPPKK